MRGLPSKQDFGHRLPQSHSRNSELGAAAEDFCISIAKTRFLHHSFDENKTKTTQNKTPPCVHGDKEILLNFSVN